MSGICAVWRKDQMERTAESLTLVNAGLSTVAAERSSQERDQFAGIGVSARFPEQQIYRYRHVLLACDADLLNEKDLADMVGRGTEVRQGAETAALLAMLYERFGDGFAEKLRGAFSFVLWDLRERRLVAGIDGFGIKRLAYYRDDKVLLIASRVDALARIGEVGLEINPRAIANILNFTTNLAPETILAKVNRLLPGTLLLASETQTKVRPYWDMRYGLVNGASEERLSEELESVVERSVADHCKSDSSQSLGAFLSGGTDSSTVVGLMDRAGRKPVEAFSIGFTEERFNELKYAGITAQRFGARHHTYLVSPQDCFNALPGMIRAFDEPFANSSAIPTYLCAKVAADNGTKVLLAGDGGDELFGGNERYQTDKIFGLYERVPWFLRKGLIEPALALLPGSIRLVEKGRNYVRRANIPALERYFSYQFLCAHPPFDVFEPDFLAATNGYSVLDVPSRYYQTAPAADHLDRLLYVDVKITLGDSDLPKVTSMSELAGIQVRFPFLDRSVAEFSGRVPVGLKVKGFEKRYLFKRAFRNLLPPEVIRKKKHGFGIPVAGWLKSDRHLRELTRDTLFSSCAFERGYFRRQFIEELFRKYEADETTYYGDTIWTFLVLELWHRQTMDGSAAKVMA